MFIPRIYKKLKENDIVILTQDFDVNVGIFTKGHEFMIISECKYNGFYAFNVIDKDGNRVVIKKSLLSIKVDYNKAKIINKKHIEFQKNLKLMASKCKFRYERYDDRDLVEMCKKPNCSSYCYPMVECNPKFWKSIKLKKILSDE